jgi:hypothetical protein
MLAIGVVAWALARPPKRFELSIVVGFVGVVYALSQIYVYQNGLLVPFLRMGAGAKLFLIGWRILFVTLYWFVMLAIAGITSSWRSRCGCRQYRRCIDLQYR